MTVLSVAILSALPFQTASAGNGETVFGVRTGYVSRNESVDAGLFFRYSFSDHFRLQPSADLVFRNNDRDAFAINLDCQFPFNFSSSRFDLYPFAGLNYSSWSLHNTKSVGDTDFGSDESVRANRFGVNMGAGFGMRVSSTLQVNFQAGYTLVKGNSGVSLLAGLGYVF